MGKLVIEESIVVETSALDVWQFFEDLKQWPQWNAGVIDAGWVSGNPWTKGSIFQFTTLSGKTKNKIQPTIIECHPAESVTWLGKTMGIKGLHTYKFEKTNETKTMVTSHEEFSGFLLPILKRMVSVRDIKETFAKSLLALKTQVETRID